MTQLNIGIDISKAHLDIYCWPGGQSRRVPNDRSGFRALIKWLGKAQIARLVYEASGAYHRAFERYMAQHGLPLAKVNPRQARRFAEAAGTLAKTDPIDAAMLARMGAALEPAVKPAGADIIYELKELTAARRALIKDQTAVKNRMPHLSIALLKRQQAARLRQITRQINAIEAVIEHIIVQQPGLKQRYDILTSIPGIGPQAAIALLIDMPELGTCTAKQAAALAGLAPHPRQSGNWTGYARIRGGRPGLRRALYMPALVASRTNPDSKRKYDELIAKGKPPKVALTALMRKLLILANTLIKQNRLWQENPV
jgi:transposase